MLIPTHQNSKPLLMSQYTMVTLIFYFINNIKLSYQKKCCKAISRERTVLLINEKYFCAHIFLNKYIPTTTPLFINSSNNWEMLIEKDIDNWAPRWSRSDGVRNSTETCFPESPWLFSVPFGMLLVWLLDFFGYVWRMRASRYPVSRRLLLTSSFIDVFWKICRRKSRKTIRYRFNRFSRSWGQNMQ